MNLVIVEDNEHVLYQLLRLVAREPAIHVVGLATTEDEAVAAVLANAPDAVLLDLGLAAGNGVKALQRIRAAGNCARVLVLTNHGSEILRQTCESLGIDGFYDKSHEVQSCLERLLGCLPATSRSAP